MVLFSRSFYFICPSCYPILFHPLPTLSCAFFSWPFKPYMCCL